MFNISELKIIASALVLAEKSALRLAAKEGQPESVATEYRKVVAENVAVQRRVVNEMDKIVEAGKVKVNKV